MALLGKVLVLFVFCEFIGIIDSAKDLKKVEHGKESKLCVEELSGRRSTELVDFLVWEFFHFVFFAFSKPVG